MGKGRPEDPSSRWIFAPLIITAIVFAWLPPHLDHLDRWTIDGDTVRYTGLIITAVGGFLPIATIFELGHRFSIFVVLQPDHRLKTDSFYRFVRHPSSGSIVGDGRLGARFSQHHWSALNRSDVCPIIARISAEEEFLVQEFGDQYRVFQQRTRWRLLPLID